MLNGISAITIGESHKKIDKECQDYTELDLSNKNYVMAAVADGHGSKKYYRSARGSQYAAEAAKESIYEFMNDYDKFVKAYEEDREYLVNRLIKMVITKWHEKIKIDLKNSPITQDEIDKYLEGSLNKDKIPTIYGTTLLVGVMSEKCNFGFLIGDGSFVVIERNGKAFIPIEDANSKANYTTSLSSSDSLTGFVKYFLDEKPFSILLSTDGLVKSFSNDSDFLDYNQAIAMELGTLDTDDKKDQMEEKLTNLFEQRSRDGSEDDISISIIFDTQDYEQVQKGLQTRRRINKIDEQIDLSSTRLNTLSFKESQLKNERAFNISELKKLIQERKEVEEYNRQLQERRYQLELQMKKLEQEKLNIKLEQEENDKKKLDIEEKISRQHEIYKIKKEEFENNVKERKKEEENIKNNITEKDRLNTFIVD